MNCLPWAVSVQTTSSILGNHIIIIRKSPVYVFSCLRLGRVFIILFGFYRRRTLVAIGTHDLDTIEGPFTYEVYASCYT